MTILSNEGVNIFRGKVLALMGLIFLIFVNLNLIRKNFLTEVP